MGEKIKINIDNKIIEVTSDEMVNMIKDVAIHCQDHSPITTNERISYIRTVIAPYVV